jgi:hypothetical protein
MLNTLHLSKWNSRPLHSSPEHINFLFSVFYSNLPSDRCRQLIILRQSVKLSIFFKSYISVLIPLFFLVQYLPVTFPCHLHIRIFQ